MEASPEKVPVKVNFEDYLPNNIKNSPMKREFSNTVRTKKLKQSGELSLFPEKTLSFNSLSQNLKIKEASHKMSV